MLKFIKKCLRKNEIMVDERLESMMKAIIEHDEERKKFNKHHIAFMKEVRQWAMSQKKRPVEKEEPKGRIFSF